MSAESVVSGRKIVVWNAGKMTEAEIAAEIVRQAGQGGRPPKDEVTIVRWLRPDETPPTPPWELQAGSADQ